MGGGGLLKQAPPYFLGRVLVATDTYGDYGPFDLGPDRELRDELRRRLVREDASLRPWLLGKAIRDFRYTRWERIKFAVLETVSAAWWSWRMSR